MYKCSGVYFGVDQDLGRRPEIKKNKNINTKVHSELRIESGNKRFKNLIIDNKIVDLYVHQNEINSTSKNNNFYIEFKLDRSKAIINLEQQEYFRFKGPKFVSKTAIEKDLKKLGAIVKSFPQSVGCFILASLDKRQEKSKENICNVIKRLSTLKYFNEGVQFIPTFFDENCKKCSNCSIPEMGKENTPGHYRYLVVLVVKI